MSKIKVLLIHPNPTDATNFYRGIGPLTRLAQKSNSEIEIIDGSDMQLSWDRLHGIDVLFYQRPLTKGAYDVLKLAKKVKVPIWLDYDDDYSGVPENHGRFLDYNREGGNLVLQDCLALADWITVSTQEIHDTIQASHPEKKTFIEIVPNAYDDALFALPKRHQEKIVLWRGGDGHDESLNVYKDQILKCFFKHPQYTWVFMGRVPSWLSENPDVPNERLKIYQWTDIMSYFDSLMEIRPEISLVLLDDNHFNRCRSNNAWIESTLAGAVTIASDLPEFKKLGVISTQKTNLAEVFDFAVNCNQDNYFEASAQSIPRLSDVNEKRMWILSKLVRERRALKKFVSHKVDLTDVVPYTDKEFFEYYLKSGYTQETDKHLEANYRFADWLIETFKPETMIEFGAGPGIILERMHQEQINAIGLELNPYFIDYFKARNPLTAHMMLKADITGDLVFPHKYDLGVSIEVFEHISIPEEKWNALIRLMAENIKIFVFTSTPYQDSIKFDFQWGHCNVRRFEKWVELFERNGWKFHSHPQKAAAWDIVFKSQVFDDVETIVIQ